MVTEREFAEFLKCLDSHDPLGVFVPKSLEVISGKWSCEDAKYLPVLLSMLEGALAFVGTALEREINNERRFFCLDAICKIDRHPQAIPAAVRDCFDADENAMQRMARKYIGRALAVDASTRSKVDGIMYDGGTYVGTRILAYLARRRIKRRRLTA